MKKRLLAKEIGYNQYWQEDDGKIIISTEATQDVDTLLQKNHNEKTQFSGYKGDFHKVASIDSMTLAKLMKDGKLHDKAYMKRFLNDPDNKKFRTTTGKL